MRLLGTGTQIAGKGAGVGVLGVLLTQSRWTASWRVDDLDTVNFESGGRDEGIVGVTGVEYNFSGDYDASFNYFDDPPAVIPREDLTGLQLYLNFASNLVWFFPYARVLSAANSAEVRGKVSYEAAGKSQGPVEVPTGNFPDIDSNPEIG